MPRSQRPDPSQPVTDLQQRFVDEYLVDLNTTAAARRAGYAPGSTHNADKIVTPVMRRLIEEGLAERAHRRRAEADKVIAELARLAFANMADYLTIDAAGLPRFDLSRLTRDEAAGIASLTVDYFPPPQIRKRDRDLAARTGRPLPPPLDQPPAPRRIRIQLADKRAALVDLARHLGVAHPDTGRERDGGEEETYNGTAVYKFVHVITNVPRHDEPTGKRGYMVQIAGPRPCPQRPDPPESEDYLKALADLRAQRGEGQGTGGQP
jgi:phage terminase small subunit